jgi:poly(3-hydroxybutyrate) depolymerase
MHIASANPAGMRALEIPMLLRTIVAVLALHSMASRATAEPAPLPAYGADAKQTSVSGLSAGAYMAVQLQVAYSASIIGAGVIAGGPFYCAAGNALFVTLCMGQIAPYLPGASSSVGTAEGYALSHAIDPLTHLRHRRLYFFSGTLDGTVHPTAVDAAVESFRRLGVDEHGIAYVRDVPAGHAMLAPDAVHHCDVTASPYVNRCDIVGVPYDQARAVLTQIYGALQPPQAGANELPVAFDQRPFADAASAMAGTGYVYAPSNCSVAGAHCRVHVALHGCMQDAESVDAAFYRGAGFNRWAAANRLIVLYPQVSKSPANPFGCWDWWGYTGAGYAKKSAPQMKAIMAMVKRLTRP